ncbi:MFS transporter [Schaalia canis]|uniref:MFS transporter n=1 Tax=Schaalia canis TaxID=100469 RepID=A0A3P1SF22_9ACTO|nr:MFS transporter [Schaalia canis]RRC95577.1 MFS transporter [Schaalia canis]
MTSAAPTQTPNTPGSLTLRRARAAVFALFLTNGALFAAVVPRFPEIKDIFGLSEPVYGLTVALFPLGAITAGPIAGRIIRRFSSARTAAMGTVGVGIMMSMVGIFATLNTDAASSALKWVLYMLFAVSFFMAGACDAITDVGQNAHGLRVQKHYGRPIINSFHAGWSIGAMCGALLGSIAVGISLPLPLHLIGSSLCFVALGVAVQPFLLRGRDSAKPGLDAAQMPEGTQALDAANPASSHAATIALPVGILLASLTLMSIAGMLIEDASSTWSALYLRDQLGVTGSAVGAAFVTMLATQALGRFAADRVIARIGARATLQAGGLLIVAGMGIALLWPSLPTTLIGMAAAGIGCAASVPLAMNAADDLPGLPVGTGLTIVTWLGRLAFLCAPPIVGLIVAATSLTSAMIVLPLGGLMIALTALVLRPNNTAK